MHHYAVHCCLQQIQRWSASSLPDQTYRNHRTYLRNHQQPDSGSQHPHSQHPQEPDYRQERRGHHALQTESAQRTSPLPQSRQPSDRTRPDDTQNQNHQHHADPSCRQNPDVHPNQTEHSYSEQHPQNLPEERHVRHEPQNRHELCSSRVHDDYPYHADRETSEMSLHQQRQLRDHQNHSDRLRPRLSDTYRTRQNDRQRRHGLLRRLCQERQPEKEPHRLYSDQRPAEQNPQHAHRVPQQIQPAHYVQQLRHEQQLPDRVHQRPSDQEQLRHEQRHPDMHREQPDYSAQHSRRAHRCSGLQFSAYWIQPLRPQLHQPLRHERRLPDTTRPAVLYQRHERRAYRLHEIRPALQQQKQNHSYRQHQQQKYHGQAYRQHQADQQPVRHGHPDSDQTRQERQPV